MGVILGVILGSFWGSFWGVPGGPGEGTFWPPPGAPPGGRNFRKFPPRGPGGPGGPRGAILGGPRGGPKKGPKRGVSGGSFLDPPEGGSGGVSDAPRHVPQMPLQAPNREGGGNRRARNAHNCAQKVHFFRRTPPPPWSIHRSCDGSEGGWLTKSDTGGSEAKGPVRRRRMGGFRRRLNEIGGAARINPGACYPNHSNASLRVHRVRLSRTLTLALALTCSGPDEQEGSPTALVGGCTLRLNNLSLFWA